MKGNHQGALSRSNKRFCNGESVSKTSKRMPKNDFGMRKGEALSFSFFNVCDGAAADDKISVIEDHGLAGGQCPLGFVEYHPGISVRFRIAGK